MPVANSVPSRLFIRLDSTKDSEKLVSIKKHIDKYHGTTEVVLVLGSDANKQILRLPQTVEPKPELIAALREVAGDENIKLT
jgi:hypothetical protein